MARGIENKVKRYLRGRMITLFFWGEQVSKGQRERGREGVERKRETER